MTAFRDPGVAWPRFGSELPYCIAQDVHARRGNCIVSAMRIVSAMDFGLLRLMVEDNNKRKRTTNNADRF